jgi:hypothetical protein
VPAPGELGHPVPQPRRVPGTDRNRWFPAGFAVFKGETLRSMLLNAYGWWKVSQITYIISLVAFGLGTVYFPSAAGLSAQLQQVLISDDPANSGSVIVTLKVPGPAYTPTPPPGAQVGSHPPLNHLTSYTAVVTQVTSHVTAVTSGGF